MVPQAAADRDLAIPGPNFQREPPSGAIVINHIFVNDAGTIQGLILVQSLSGFGFRTPIYQAALAEELDLAEVTPGGSVSPHAFTSKRPVCIVAGDDGKETTGPAGFAQLGRILRWAQAVILYTAGGEEAHYRETVKLTKKHGRCLLIESNGTHRKAWLNRIELELVRRHDADLKQIVAIDIRAPDHPAHYRESPA